MKKKLWRDGLFHARGGGGEISCSDPQGKTNYYLVSEIYSPHPCGCVSNGPPISSRFQLINYLGFYDKADSCICHRRRLGMYSLCFHRRIQDFVRGGGGQGPLGPLDPRLTIWGSNFLWGGGGGKAPLPPLDPRLVLWKPCCFRVLFSGASHSAHLGTVLRASCTYCTERKLPRWAEWGTSVHSTALIRHVTATITARLAAKLQSARWTRWDTRHKCRPLQHMFSTLFNFSLLWWV